MSVISFKNAKISYDDNTIVRDCNFRVGRKEKIGLIGNNGTGKTSLLRCILGELDVVEGDVQRNKDLKFGYFSQFSQLMSTKSIREILEGLFLLEKELNDEFLMVSEKLSASGNETVTRELMSKQAELLVQIDEMDAWAKLGSIDIVLRMLKFDDVLANRPIDELSEGWKNRAAFALIILNEPDVLLLDEPTNFLDVEGLIWLERWLSKFNGAAIIISHDRNFLNNTITRVLEIENHRIHDYVGNYTEYTKLKPFKKKHLEGEFNRELELMALERNNSEENQKKRENGERLVKRSEVQRSRVPSPVDKIITDLYEELKFPSQLLKVKGVTKRVQGVELFDGISFNLVKGDRMVIYGPNGCGKTTFLNILTSDEIADNGKINWSSEEGFVSFARVAKEIDRNKTLSHAITLSKIAHNAPKKKSNAFLRLMGFSENDMKKPIGQLSGGQFSRAVLAACLLSGQPVLILDEPTNHLDLLSIRVMERALTFFPGAIIASSHDRFFIDSVATSMLIFDKGKVNHFRGDWSMYCGKKG